MRNIVNEYIKMFEENRRARRKTLGVIGILALFVAFGVFWNLHFTGIALTDEVYYCGIEEHQHDENCYEWLLTDAAAAETEGEALPASVMLSEAVESEDWYLNNGYEQVLICNKEEHKHTAECLMNENADVETAEDWEATLPETLNGTAAENLVAVAQSQLGYTESEQNFTLADDGETRNGYSRYGEWYGNAYGEWNSMFVAFCLHYAGISEEDFPVNSGAYAWSVQLADDDLYVTSDEYNPIGGDLIFLDTDKDGKADLVGIVETVDSVTLTVILGDDCADSDEGESSADAVCRVEYASDDAAILGYGMLPDVEVNPPAIYVKNTENTDLTTDEEVSVEPESETAYETYMAALAKQEEAAYALEVGDDADAVEIAAYLKELLDAAKADLADGNLTQDEYDEIEFGIDKPLTWLDDNFDLSWTPDTDEVDAAEEEELLTVEFTAEADGITVEAWAAEGIFPEGTTMSVTLLEADNEETAQQYEEAIAAIEESEEEYEYDGLVLFDISFFDEDGNEIEPEEGTVSVKVTMDASLVNDEVDETSSLELYHLKESDDGAEVVTVADTEGLAGGTVDVDEDGTVLAEFSVESFSIFWVRGTNFPNGSTLCINAIDETFTNAFMGTEGTNIVEASDGWESIENISINYIIEAAQSGYIYEYACPTRSTGTKITYVRQDQNTGRWYYWDDSSTVPGSSDTGTQFYFEDNGRYSSTIYLVFSKYTAKESNDEEITPSYSKYVSDNEDGTYDLTLTVSGDSTSTISGKVDIVYILDVSGSMGQELTSTSQGVDDRYERWEAAASAVTTLTKAISSDESIDAWFSSVIFASNGDGDKEYDKECAEYYNNLYNANSNGTYNDAVVLQSWTNSATSLIGSLPTMIDVFIYGQDRN